MNKPSWLIICFFTLTVSAQDKLVVMGTLPNMYVVYPTSGTESLQNISNQFGMSVAKLLAYNHININPTAAFAKGTEIKIPFTKDNLIQQPNESSAPLYHAIKKGESLYRLSLAYNKVPIAVLRGWNSMKKDIVKDGQLIMIGYLVNGKAPVEKKTEPKKDINAINGSQLLIPATPEKKYTDKKEPSVPKPVAKDQAIKITPEEIKKEEPLVTKHSSDTKETRPADIKKPAIEVKKKEEPATDYTPKEGDEGYFASGYNEHSGEQTQQFHSGDAATFKTISGWTDRKFYVLMNDVAPKTIVRITGTTNKNICAMVLGPLQETQGASGLLLRLSNSAASALGITEPKFTITVTYFE